MSDDTSADDLTRLIGYQTVQIFEQAKQIVSLTAERDALSGLVKELLKEREAPEPPVTKAELQDTVKMLNAGDSESDIDTRLEALEVSKRATLLTDLPLTLTPEALKDKTIN